MAKLFETIGKFGLALAVGGGIVNSALFNGGCFSVFYVFLLELKFCWNLLDKANFMAPLLFTNIVSNIF